MTNGTPLQPHRGTLILILGIASFFCCPLIGIAAWVMGNSDLKAMAEGRMDPAGEGLTKAGKIIGIVTLALGVLAAIGYGILIAMGVAAGLASQ